MTARLRRREPGRSPQPAPAGSPAPVLRSAPWIPLAVGLAALGILLWMCRHAVFGAPVADDFHFLERARIAGPVDPFDGGGFDYYWRPLSRQLYYAVFGDAMLQAPWILGGVHAAALAALAALLWHIGRRFLAPPTALSFALLPLVAESSRLLLVWPACAQPLLGAVAAAGAISALLAGRTVLASTAILAGALAYEQVAWLAPLLLVLGVRGTDRGSRVRAICLIVAAAALWVAGLTIAHRHGVQWPASGVAGAASAPREAIALGATVGQMIAVLGNVDTLAPLQRTILLLGQGAILALACLAPLLRRPRRAPGRITAPPSGPALAACGLWGLIGLAPALLAPDLWAPRHALMPGLLLGFVALAWCERAAWWLAPAFVAVRFLALLGAPVASATDPGQPRGDARTSFVELVRLQHILASTERALVRHRDAHPRGAAYWMLPPRSAVGFANGRAPRVWMRDPEFGWGWLERPIRDPRQIDWLVLAFEPGEPDPAIVVDPKVVEGYFAGIVVSDAESLARGDSTLAQAARDNGPRPQSILDEIDRLRAGYAAVGGDLSLAESLNTVSERRYGTRSDHFAIAGWIALRRGDEEHARRMAQSSLRMEPGQPLGEELLVVLDRRAGARATRSGPGSPPEGR